MVNCSVLCPTAVNQDPPERHKRCRVWGLGFGVWGLGGFVTVDKGPLGRPQKV